MSTFKQVKERTLLHERQVIRMTNEDGTPNPTALFVFHLMELTDMPYLNSRWMDEFIYRALIMQDLTKVPITLRFGPAELRGWQGIEHPDPTDITPYTKGAWRRAKLKEWGTRAYNRADSTAIGILNAERRKNNE